MSRIEAARRLLDVHRPREALEELRRELEHRPESVEAWRMIVFVHAALDEPEPALRASEQALRLAPDDAWVLYARAYALGASGRVREALGACEEAIGLDPHADAFHSYRAALLDILERREEALASVDEALSLDPEDAYALDVRIGLLRELGRDTEAESTARHALALHPESADFHEHLGGLALSRGDARAADASFREALKLRPGSVAAKSGAVDALRARSPVYRKLFAFAGWSRRRGARLWTTRAKLVYAGYVAITAAAVLASDRSDWTLVLVIPMVSAFVLGSAWVFAYVAVTMLMPLFLLGVWLDPFGRHALKDTLRARWSEPTGVLAPRFRWSWLWLVFLPYAALPLLLLAPVLLARRCRPGRARTALLAASAIHPLAGAAVVAILAYEDASDRSHAAAGVVTMAGIAAALAIVALVVRWRQSRAG